MLLLTTACASSFNTKSTSNYLPQQVESFSSVDPHLQARAIGEAEAKRSRGQRVWCVPFARTASGVNISGNAATWWSGARGEYSRGQKPSPGSVMVFSSSRAMPMGHVAVVSEIVSSRTIRVNHANWNRNQISLGMKVVDVSASNDWSSVRVENQPGTLGRVNPVSGFIYPGQT